jgi:uncharacterized membrane protein
MAGIGFRLQGYFKSASLADRVRGSTFSVIISCGPWLMTILSIAAISYFAQRSIGEQELLLFKCVISYTFAASLICFGAIEMPLTRYLADKLFIDDKTSFRQVLAVVLGAAVVVGSILGGIFYSFFAFGPWLAFSCTVLFPLVIGVWLSMVFLSASKNYKRITTGFLGGSLATVFLCWYLGSNFGLPGYILGFILGQLTVLVILLISIQLEFSGKEYFSLEFTGYFRRHRLLILVGLFYYLGIWVDKFVFWFTPPGRFVTGLFFLNQYYDTGMFLAYLTVVPAIAIFFVQVETNFYMHYSYYFRSIDHKVGLPVLDKNIEGMHQSLRDSLSTLFKFQTFVTVLCWYFSDALIEALHLPSLVAPIFRYGVLGSYFLSLFIFANIVLLYFLAERRVFQNYAIFFVSNFVFSLLTAYGDPRYHGLGFAASTLLTLIVSYQSLNRRLGRINMHTFMDQQIEQKGQLNIT